MSIKLNSFVCGGTRAYVRAELRRLKPDPLNLSVNTVVGKQKLRALSHAKSALFYNKFKIGSKNHEKGTNYRRIGL